MGQYSLSGYDIVYLMQLGIVGVLLPSRELPSRIGVFPASGCYFYAIGLCCSICCGHVALVTPLTTPLQYITVFTICLHLLCSLL